MYKISQRNAHVYVFAATLIVNPYLACLDPEGGGMCVCVCVGGGVWTPLKNHKNIGFLSNIGQDLANY